MTTPQIATLGLLDPPLAPMVDDLGCVVIEHGERGYAPATFDATCADCGTTLTYHGKPLGPGETFHCGCSEEATNA